VDIFENEKKELVLKAELPDVRKEDVSVTVENNTLTLSGERKFDTEVKREHYHRIERSYGNFSRSFSLPATVDTGKIAAEFKSGVLTIRLPFRDEAKPRSISIDVAS
jgi:HSP20 family protein